MPAYSREKAKVAAALRFERGLQKALDQIDWVHDVYNPTLARFERGELKLTSSPGGRLLEIEKAPDA